MDTVSVDDEDTTNNFVEDVDKFLEEIEKKYSTTCVVPSSDDAEEQLRILSQEFATFGLEEINMKQPTEELLQEITDRSLLLIELHRRTLSQITDISICNKSKDSRNNDLEKIITSLQTKLQLADDKNVNLNRIILRQNMKIADLNSSISMHSEQMNRLKQFFQSEQNKLTLQVHNLQGENQHLKQICGTNIDKYFSKEDKYFNVLKKYRDNEGVYKNALNKLEENNAEIMNEILNLKNELALAYLKET